VAVEAANHRHRQGVRRGLQVPQVLLWAGVVGVEFREIGAGFGLAQRAQLEDAMELQLFVLDLLFEERLHDNGAHARLL
jgi:hypothetical protein